MTKQESSSGSIDFGRRGEWIRLYAERASCSQEYRRLTDRRERLMRSLAERQQGNVQRVLGMLGTPTPPQQGNFLADLDLFDRNLTQQADLARAIAGNIQDVSIEITVEKLELDNAAAANDDRYHSVHRQLRERERGIGQQYGGDVPLYMHELSAMPIQRHLRMCGLMLGVLLRHSGSLRRRGDRRLHLAEGLRNDGQEMRWGTSLWMFSAFRLCR